MPAAWWEDAIRSVALAHGVSASALEEWVGSPETSTGSADRAWIERSGSIEALHPEWRQVLIVLADCLEAGAAAGSLESGRSGLRALAQLSELFGAGELGSWAARLAESGELPRLSRGAARVLREAAEEMEQKGRIAPLRARTWEWPELEVEPEPEPGPAIEPDLETEPEATIEPEATTELEGKTEPEATIEAASPEPELELELPTELQGMVAEEVAEIEAPSREAAREVEEMETDVIHEEMAAAPTIDAEIEARASEPAPVVEATLEPGDLNWPRGQLLPEAAPETEMMPVIAPPLVVESIPVAATTEEPPVPMPTTATLHALVADDSAIARAFLARLLAQHGVEATAVEDGGQAERVLAKRDFDVLFLDLSMPVGGGADLLRSHPEWAERTILTGATLGEARRAEAMSAPFLLKPVSEEELTSLLAGLRMRRETRGDRLSSSEES